MRASWSNMIRLLTIRKVLTFCGKICGSYRIRRRQTLRPQGREMEESEQVLRDGLYFIAITPETRANEFTVGSTQCSEMLGMYLSGTPRGQACLCPAPEENLFLCLHCPMHPRQWICLHIGRIFRNFTMAQIHLRTIAEASLGMPSRKPCPPPMTRIRARGHHADRH